MFRPIYITPDIIMLMCVHTRWPNGCNVYLVRDIEGSWSLFDTSIGTLEGIQSLLYNLKELHIYPKDIRKIILTHAHTDHMGGAGHLMEISQGTLFIPEKDVSEAIDVHHQAEMIMPHYIQALFPELASVDFAKHFRSTVSRMLKPNECNNIVQHGDIINIGVYKWEAVHTPGHDIGLMVYFNHDTGLLISGDLFAVKGTVLPWYSPSGGGVNEYLNSLLKVEALPAKKILPAHGNVLTDVDNPVQTTREKILRRENILLRTLSKGPQTFRVLDRSVFSIDVWKVVPWCSAMTCCHLAKLSKEKQIVFDSERDVWMKN